MKLFHLFWNQFHISLLLFISALQQEQDLDLGKLAEIDVIEAKEASTLALIQKIRCNLTKVGLQQQPYPKLRLSKNAPDSTCFYQLLFIHTSVSIFRLYD